MKHSTNVCKIVVVWLAVSETVIFGCHTVEKTAVVWRTLVRCCWLIAWQLLRYSVCNRDEVIDQWQTNNPYTFLCNVWVWEVKSRTLKEFYDMLEGFRLPRFHPYIRTAPWPIMSRPGTTNSLPHLLWCCFTLFTWVWAPDHVWLCRSFEKKVTFPGYAHIHGCSIMINLVLTKNHWASYIQTLNAFSDPSQARGKAAEFDIIASCFHNNMYNSPQMYVK